MSKDYVNLENARLEEQRNVMEEIQKQKVCPFCPEYLSRFHKKPILKETSHWILTYNQWPYENTKAHLLAIYKNHAEHLRDLTPQSGQELLELFQWAEKEFNVYGGGVGMRFGNIKINGGTVSHIHVQFLEPNITDKNNPQYVPVRLKLG